jgi:hypothetical protein
MIYIKPYSQYKDGNINEEFIGGLLNSIKNKLSLGFSKMFGNANEAEKIMNQYKEEIDKINKVKIDALKNYAKYIKLNKEEIDKEELKKLYDNYNKIDNNFKAQIGVLKERFDIKLNDVIKKEKNPKISNYINLKKLEMQQAVLANELSVIIDETGLTEEELKNSPELAKIVQSTKNRIKKVNDMAKEQVKILKEKAKQDSLVITEDEEIRKIKNRKEGWNDSPFVTDESKLKKGDIIEYYSVTNNKFMVSKINEIGKDVVVVKSDKGDLIRINKNRIKSKNNPDLN